METSVEDVDGNIWLKLNKWLVNEGENEISVSGTKKFIYAFYDTDVEENGSKRVKEVI